MKKKYLLGLALLPLCLGGCASNSSNNAMVVYCSGYIYGGEYTICEHCKGLNSDAVHNIIDNDRPAKLGWYIKSVSASACSYRYNHMHYAVLWSK